MSDAPSTRIIASPVREVSRFTKPKTRCVFLGPPSVAGLDAIISLEPASDAFSKHGSKPETPS